MEEVFSFTHLQQILRSLHPRLEKEFTEFGNPLIEHFSEQGGYEMRRDVQLVLEAFASGLMAGYRATRYK